MECPRSTLGIKALRARLAGLGLVPGPAVETEALFLAEHDARLFIVRKDNDHARPLALGESSHTRQVIAELASEIFAVMHRAGHVTRWPDPESFLKSLYGELLPPTRAHESSTLQDLRAGRRTEIDALNGAIVRLGRQFGIETPVNQTLCALIRTLESRKADP